MGPTVREAELIDATQQTASTNLQDYTWQNYLAYILYPPLYIGGPIITFNSFIDQIKKRAPIPKRDILTYAIRFVVCWLTMEILLHYMYIVAIKDSWATFQDANGKLIKRMAWEGDTPFELAMISFWNLVVMWLKVSTKSRQYIDTCGSLINFVLVLALAALAIFQVLVIDGWYRPSGEYDTMCIEQLFYERFLEKLASVL